MYIIDGILALFWVIVFIELFFEETPSKFTAGCAYLIVIITFLQRFFEGVVG